MAISDRHERVRAFSSVASGNILSRDDPAAWPYPGPPSSGDSHPLGGDRRTRGKRCGDAPARGASARARVRGAHPQVRGGPAMTPFTEWSSEHAEIATSEEWTFAEIDVDLSGAVTIVVDIGAEIELGESEGVASLTGGDSQIWTGPHEVNVSGFLQHSI